MHYPGDHKCLLALLCLFQVHHVFTQDTIPPTLTCPNTTVIGNGAVVRWQTPTATDNSGGVYLSSTHSVGDYFPLGNTTVTYTARDASGLQSNCSFIVEVIADGSPEISDCPESTLEVTVAAGVTSSNVTWTAPTAVDPDGGTVAASSDYVPGATFQLGTTKVTYTFVDDAGQRSKCVFRVRVQESSDAVPPTIVTSCPDDITIDVAPVPSVSVTWDEPTFSDLVDGNTVTVMQTKESGSLFPRGSTEVLYTAMDSNYNMVQCIFTVTINVTDDNIPPTIYNCPNDTFLWVAMGTTEVNITWTSPTATDNYGTPTLRTTSDPGSAFSVGVTVVNYTATDHVNNVAYCSFTVTILVDDEIPVITGCPGNIVEYVQPDVASLAVTWTTPTVTDNSGEFNSSTNFASGSMFQASVAGENDVVMMIYEDRFGNTAVCSFTVNVLIDMPPVFSCPSPIIQDNELGEAYADVSWPQLTITDDYTSLANLVITMSHSEPLRVFYDSPVSVTYSATDERGNVATCTFTVTVNDVENPVWQTCPAFITRPLDPGTNSAIVSWPEPTVLDNSGVDPTVTSTASNPELFFAGSYTVEYIARDEAGNEAKCEFMVVIETDENVPVFDNCPVGTLNFEADLGTSTTIVSWPTITATDDLDIRVTITSNFNPGQEFSIGTYSVEYQARDNAGNVGYCGFTVVVADLQQPEIRACPSDQSFFVLNAASDVKVSWSEPQATDNSGTVTLSQTSGRGSGSRFGRGTSNIVYRAEDTTGNFAECSFVISVTVKQDTISLDGSLTLDIVRGLDGIFGGSSRRDNLRNDLDNLFRGTQLGSDFVGLEITSGTFDTSSNYVIEYTIYLCATAHYNEESIKDIFNGALTGDNRDIFSTSNVIERDSLDFNVVEFRGQFTLKSIENPGTVPVNYQSCCSDPSSSTYQSLQNRIYDHLQRTYGTMTPFRMSKILFLTPGSVIVDYTLTYDPVSAPAASNLEQRFNDTVTPGSLELTEGVSTGLYLEVNGVKAGSVQAVCSSDYCLNGGTCMITNSSSYEISCSCPYRYYGDRCQNEGLSWEVIVAIALGAILFLIIIFLILACCCYFLLYARENDLKEEARRSRKRERRLQRLYRQSVSQVPLIMRSPKVKKPIQIPRPMNDYVYSNGSFIHEIIDERQPNGPKFHHDDKENVSQPRSPPLKRAHPPDDDVKVKRKHREKGPRFTHDSDPPKKTQKKKKVVRILSPSLITPSSPPRVQKTRRHKPEPEKKKRKEKGPTFHADGEPELVEEMKQQFPHEFMY
ncbi:hyalin-like isoform X1 [Lytechinus variegatus]|uniref:hyalin-like isoform X1 n=1 Tax=Lytechinus variegatus TaxID=7654 RepID=UPI001BB235FB|nr:hyalin-like isoform X1 [Lytechinus variegatus]